MSGCVNCPYGYTDKVDPNVPAEFSDSWDDFVPDAEEDDEDNDED